VDVARAYSAVSPTVEGDALVVLAGTTQPLTGRRVARLARRGSSAAVAKALGRLVEQGLVVRQEAPPASLYSLNRHHVAAPAVEMMAGIRTELLKRLRDEIADWSTPPVHASLFGSAARQDGDAASDVDLLVVRPSRVDAESATWSRQLRDLAEAVHTWTGNHAAVVELAEQEMGSMLVSDTPILQDIRRDGVDLAGLPLRRLLEGAA
jgi:predicted nucleotidyltransferase